MVWILPESAVRQEELTQRLAMLLGCLDNGENHRATTIVGSIFMPKQVPQIQHPDTISSNPCHAAPMGFPKMGDRRNHRSMQFYREKALIFGFEKHPQGIILLSYSHMVIILLSYCSGQHIKIWLICQQRGWSLAT